MRCIAAVTLLLAQTLSAESFYYNGGEQVTLTPIKNIKRSLSAHDFYQDPRGNRVGVSKGILLGLKDELRLETLLEESGAKLIKKLGSGIYLIEVDDKRSTIDVANALHEKESVLFAHPDFLRERKVR